MIEKLYDWMMKKAESKNAVSFLMLISFIESSFFPLPPDPILAVVVAKNRNKTMYYAGMCTAASVLGGFLGYYIGFAFFETVGSAILSWLGLMKKFEDINPDALNRCAFWIICAKGLTPIPYKLVTIASGFAKVNVYTFAVASLITRSMRFILLSVICKIFGKQFLNFIEKHKAITLYFIIISVIIGFLLVKILL